MCGRFTLRTPLNVLIEQFELAEAASLRPRFNIAPTQTVAVVRQPSGTSARHLSLLRWGLVPAWAQDLRIGARLINARAETVAEKPAFRAAFKSRRCLIPADGYYEWQKTGARKQPYFIRLQDDRPFALAGLWERWSGSEGDPPLETCTIITTAANGTTASIHDRMPAILAQDDYSLWLDPDLQDRPALEQLLRPFDAQPMCAIAVSTHVNNVRHDDARCVAAQPPLFD